MRNILRPDSIDLLISMLESHLHADKKVKTICKLSLFSGPLGLVFGGEDPERVIPTASRSFVCSVRVAPAVQTFTFRAAAREALTGVTNTFLDRNPEKKLLKCFHEESIGVECSPKCGNCQCRKCALGSKKMSLRDEREYAQV